MKIAVASGKGGTGKTTVSVSLALSADVPVQYLDCDVEEPNGELFLKPEESVTTPSCVLVPKIDTNLCDGCGDCAELCQFNAIASQGEYAMVFPELCHSCGGCVRVCTHHAIEEIPYKIGTLKTGKTQHIHYIQGKLDIGVTMSPPLIREVKCAGKTEELTILDCPPGTSCPMIVTVRDADFVLLVTEPTPFGLNDLKLAVETMRELARPFAVIINRDEKGNRLIDDYCSDEKIDIAMKIPNNREVATACSNGETLLSIWPEYKAKFRQLIGEIETNMIGVTNG